MMPGKSGLEFTNEYKKKLIHLLFFLLQKVRLMKELKALRSGADDYLAKPFEPKELVLRINNILNKTKKNNQKE